MATSVPFVSQLPLDIGLDDRFSFDNFDQSGQEVLVERLIRFADADSEQCFYLFGGASSGKSHLLQAICQRTGVGSFYLPLNMAKEYDPSCLHGMGGLALVALDDVDEVIYERPWAEAIFHLFNELRDSGGRIIVSSSVDADSVNCALPDLRSRLKWGELLALGGLDDDRKKTIIRMRSEQRGMEMSEDVAQFLMTRCSRDLGHLMRLIEQLDKASMAAQRKLTVPFIKEVLAAGSTIHD